MIYCIQFNKYSDKGELKMKLSEHIHYMETAEQLFKLRHDNGVLEINNEFWFVKFLPLSGIMYAECGREFVTLTYNLSIDLDSNIQNLIETIEQS